jgi:Coenzyme PQQ synthesis protein D (PqqD)
MYRFSEGIHTVRSSDGAVVLDVPHNRIFRLNACGAAVLECVEKGRSEEEIADEIAMRHGVEREIVLNDIRAFLRSLASRGVLCLLKMRTCA